MKKHISEIFNLSQIKKFIYTKEINLKNEFVALLKDKKYFESAKVGIKLYDMSPYFLLFSYLIILRDKPSKHKKQVSNKDVDNIKKLLEILVTKVDLNIHLLIYFLQNRMFVEMAIEEIKKTGVKDYLYYIALKEILKITGNGSTEVLGVDINTILDNLDDWDVYEYSYKNNIRLKFRDTVNYKYYLLHMKEDSECNLKGIAEKLLYDVKAYKDIKYIVETFKVGSHKDDLVNDIIQYIKYGYKKDTAFKLYNKFISLTDFTRSITNLEIFGYVKLLLSHLIASKKINNLILALFICHKNYVAIGNTFSNYEINLIYMFLCRYFLLHTELFNLFSVMDIKNNQLFNLSFILNDVLVIKQIDDRRRVNEHLTIFNENINILLTNIPKFIEVKKVSYAINLLDLYFKFKDNILFKELNEAKILSKEPHNLFSDTLSSHSSHIFNKLTKGDAKRFRLHKNDKRATEKYFNTIDGVLHEYSSYLFSNDLFNIDVEDFIGWFKCNLFL